MVVTRSRTRGLAITPVASLVNIPPRGIRKRGTPYRRMAIRRRRRFGRRRFGGKGYIKRDGQVSRHFKKSSRKIKRKIKKIKKNAAKKGFVYSTEKSFTGTAMGDKVVHIGHGVAYQSVGISFWGTIYHELWKKAGVHIYEWENTASNDYGGSLTLNDVGFKFRVEFNMPDPDLSTANSNKVWVGEKNLDPTDTHYANVINIYAYVSGAVAMLEYKAGSIQDVKYSIIQGINQADINDPLTFPWIRSQILDEEISVNFEMDSWLNVQNVSTSGDTAADTSESTDSVYSQPLQCVRLETKPGKNYLTYKHQKTGAGNIANSITWQVHKKSGYLYDWSKEVATPGAGGDPFIDTAKFTGAYANLQELPTKSSHFYSVKSAEKMTLSPGEIFVDKLTFASTLSGFKMHKDAFLSLWGYSDSNWDKQFFGNIAVLSCKKLIQHLDVNNPSKVKLDMTLKQYYNCSLTYKKAKVLKMVKEEV